MRNVKAAGTGIGAMAGLVVAAAALSGCTSSTSASASGPSSSSAARGAAGSTASGAGSAGGGITTGTSTGDAGGGTTTAAGSTSCSATALKITETSVGASDGHAGWVVVFTNAGSASCSVTGYPGAGVTDNPGDVVLNATRTQEGYIGGEYSKPATIVLKPGSAASTVIEWLDAPTDGTEPVGANCPGMDGGHVLITPPNTEQSTPFPSPANLCAGFKVHPLVPGASGRAH